MMTRIFAAPARARACAVAAILVAVVLSLASASVSAAILTLYYDPATGNLKLQNVTSSSLPLQSFNVLTLGNGTVGAPSGQPGNIGFLSTGTATMPTAAFLTSNTNSAGLNGVNSQAYAANVGSAIMTLTAYPGWSASSPIGPVGSYWDLGNIAVAGMTQGNLNSRFLTDPEITPPNFDTPAFGSFLFEYESSPGTFTLEVGEVLVAVPEPATVVLGLTAVACSGVGLAVRRRKRTG